MLLSVNDIHVYYGAIHAVKGVSLEVNEGEVVTLIGANGAGKSTVLNTISGLLRAKSGTIDFMGTPINTMAPNKIVQLGLAQCPEGRRVFAHMTVEENLEMGAYTRPNSTIEGNLEHVYELFPRLKERRKQVGGTLSGGEQQMLAMGRAMMSEPKLLMLDEPSMGLAPILSSRSSISSASCTRPAPRSCSSSRTHRWRCRSQTAPTSLRPARSPSPAPAKSFWKATPSKKPIWAVDFQSIQTDSTQFPLRTVCFLQYPISIAFLGIYVIIRKNHNLHPNTKRKGWFFMKMKRVWRVHAS